MNDLRQLAEAARDNGQIIGHTGWHEDSGRDLFIAKGPDVAFLAACSPERILKLLDVVDKAQALVAACDVINTNGRGYAIGAEASACAAADEALRAAIRAASRTGDAAT